VVLTWYDVVLVWCWCGVGVVLVWCWYWCGVGIGVGVVWCVVLCAVGCMFVWCLWWVSAIVGVGEGAIPTISTLQRRVGMCIAANTTRRKLNGDTQKSYFFTNAVLDHNKK
jgi:hypothetical protein